MSLSLLTSMLVSTASAGVDLQTEVKLQSGHEVYDEQRVRVKVKNLGTSKAKNVQLTVQLPETNTSPSVYVMGDVGLVDAKCVQTGTELDCNLKNIKGGKAKKIDVYISFPWSAEDIEVYAWASSDNTDTNPGNDDDLGVISMDYIDTPISGPAGVTNQHCTGTGLSAFYECTLFPSSISSHQATLEADGSISFAFPGYAGSWSQDSDDHLWFEYTQAGNVVAEFEGNGVGGDCFEGLTTFNGSGYVAPYEVCLD